MKFFTTKDIIKSLNKILDIEQDVSGIDYLKKLVKNCAREFEVKYVFIGQPTNPGLDKIKTNVCWANTDYQTNFTYELKDTPCENVFSGKRVCVYPKGVAEKFPKDRLLVDFGVESYIGAPLLKNKIDFAGILVFLDDKPIKDVGFYTAIVDFLASRASLELDRHNIEEELRSRVDERTSELKLANRKLVESLSEIKTLQGIIPICCSCKSIRDDQENWKQMEEYISNHSDAQFSHGYCPDCLKKLHPDLAY